MAQPEPGYDLQAKVERQSRQIGGLEAALKTARRERDESKAAVKRAERLAEQWAVLRTYGSAATELSKALRGDE